MSTAYIAEVPSYMSYKCKTLNELYNSNSCRTLKGPDMAPLVEQEKNTGNDLVADHPDEQYTSTETNSSGNISDGQPDHEDNVSKLRNLPLNDSPQNVNGSLNHELRGAVQNLTYLTSSLSQMSTLQNNIFSIPNGIHKPANSPITFKEQIEFDGLYPCLKCDFVGRNDDELHNHAYRHDPYECSTCGYLADSPDGLKPHMKEEHPELPEKKLDDYILFHETESMGSPPKKKSSSKIKPFEENIDKPRKTSCKICNNFTGNTKMEYYEHLREMHSENGKLLTCDMCPFIALYKHHLEYHYRNHFGSKPFKCDKCDYACVNRSMLNSHYKSHSDVYQYSCSNCQYMTKYLHSLKMHLRKYSHQPGRTLNPDGSINDDTVIDVHGKRRGPKGKKRKNETNRMQEDEGSPKSKSSPSPPVPSFIPNPSQNIRILYHPHIYNNYTGNLYVRPGPSEATSYMMPSPPNWPNTNPGAMNSNSTNQSQTINGGGSMFRCSFCEFATGYFDTYHRHMCAHADQDRLSDGSFNPKYPEFLQRPFNFGSIGFGPNFSGSFPRNIVNQTPVDANGSQNIEVANNNNNLFQNSGNAFNYEMMNNRLNERESVSGIATVPGVLPFNAQQHPKQNRKRKESNRMPIWGQSETPSTNATLAVKKEVSDIVNGIGSPTNKNLSDNGPLDLSIKQSPEMKSNETYSPNRLLAASVGPTTNGASSVSPKFENEESKAVTQKTNRRKGKAFKLNQYMIESDPVSDGAETELEKMRVLSESTFCNKVNSKPALGSEIKKSVPRINYKPTLNVTKWNGHSSPEPIQPDVSQSVPPHNDNPASFDSNYIERGMNRQKSRAISDSWCSLCNIDAGTPELLRCHSSYHSKNDPFTCAKCGLRCNEMDRFNWHIISGSRINGTCINAIEECKS